jgi:hypothetical protein
VNKAKVAGWAEAASSCVGGVGGDSARECEGKEKTEFIESLLLPPWPPFYPPWGSGRVNESLDGEGGGGRQRERVCVCVVGWEGVGVWGGLWRSLSQSHHDISVDL